MARDAKTDRARAQALDEIDKEIQEMTTLTEGLLAHSRLAFDVTSKMPHDVAALAQAQLARFGHDASVMNVDGAPRMVDVDANLLAHAISNLLANAERHGTGLRSLTVTYEVGEVVIEVCDGGPGVEATRRGTLFEPFAGTGSQKGGLGLGLSLVRRVAEAHGGTVTYEDDPEGGAVFALHLPAAKLSPS